VDYGICANFCVKLTDNVLTVKQNQTINIIIILL